MASLAPFQALLGRTCSSSTSLSAPASSWGLLHTKNKRKTPSKAVAAVGGLSSDSTSYLIAGAIGVALVGTAFPILFYRKDMVCSEVRGDFESKCGKKGPSSNCLCTVQWSWKT